jgi:hypothetical protein
MKNYVVHFIRVGMLIALLASVVSCFSSSFSKRKYTKGYYTDRVNIPASKHGDKISDRVSTIMLQDDLELSLSDLEDVEINLLSSYSDHYTQDVKTDLRGDELQNISEDKKVKKLKHYSELKKDTVYKSVKNATSFVTSKIEQKKSQMDFYLSDWGVVLAAIGIVLIVIACFVLLLTESSGCALVIIGFVLMSVGFLMAFMVD